MKIEGIIDNTYTIPPVSIILNFFIPKKNGYDNIMKTLKHVLISLSLFSIYTLKISIAIVIK